MGRKVSPISFRLASRLNWITRWYAKAPQYKDFLIEDIKLRKCLLDHLKTINISKIEIGRLNRTLRVLIFTPKPGLIIGKRGEEIDSLKKRLQALTSFKLELFVEETKRPESNASVIANSIADQIERRVTFKRAIKRLITNALRAGALGIKVMGSGRLGGAEIARKEWYKEGKVPLQTIEADIDYATSIAKTTYGIIGLKVWVNKGCWKQPLPIKVS
ncbi:30S ribosomal subunit protein S3 [Candidatus Tremblaya phenacola PAVE]|nr:30S ribosomal subunit protein S3 [Candidatus Tremblaya phenacola PAVE]